MGLPPVMELAPSRLVRSAPRSAYLHLPFCHRRCFYCDFPVVPLGDRADGSHSRSIATYLELLLQEIAAAPQGPPLSTVYLGGGTPSMLTPEQVGALLAALRGRFGFAPGAEISIELDPAGFDRDRLHGFVAAGVNRASLGGQSFEDDVLQSLGRRHRRRHLLEAAGWLREFHSQGALSSWSLDLIQGLPALGEPPDPLGHWRRQLVQAMDLAPPHLSIYDLTVEPGTVFDRQRKRGELNLPDPDLGADLMDLTWSMLRTGGYGHYEVSNYALPGHASRHNRVYWSGAGWWGFGMGATSGIGGQRQARPRTRAGYASWLAQQSTSARSGAPQSLSGPFPVDDLVMVGLRRREGVTMDELVSLQGLGPSSGESLREHLQPFLEQGILKIEGSRWRLSDPAGLAISNGVLRAFLDWWERHAGPGSSPEAPPEPGHGHPAVQG